MNIYTKEVNVAYNITFTEDTVQDVVDDLQKASGKIFDVQDGDDLDDSTKEKILQEVRDLLHKATCKLLYKEIAFVPSNNL